MHALFKQLTAIAESEHLTYFGVAQLTDWQAALAETGSSLTASFPFALALGIAIPAAIVDLLPKREDSAVSVAYYTHGYTILNTRLDLAASKLASALERAGHSALPVPAAERVDSQRICAFVSHKLVARLAGFGWIGKNCLLITPEHGPRVRWTSVLTDARLEAKAALMDERCGNCRACADACPTRALTGRAFSAGEPRSSRLDARACEMYIRGLGGRADHQPVCGMCLYACPKGRHSRMAARSPTPSEG